jgi:putative DNA methylase
MKPIWKTSYTDGLRLHRSEHFRKFRGSWNKCSDYVAKCVETITTGEGRLGTARQIDAATGSNGNWPTVSQHRPSVTTTILVMHLFPMFYTFGCVRVFWASIRSSFQPVLVPKLPELTAAQERFDGDKERAKHHPSRVFDLPLPHCAEVWPHPFR